MTNAKNFANEFTRALIAGNTARAAAVAYLQPEPCPDDLVNYRAELVPVSRVVHAAFLESRGIRRFAGMSARDVLEISRKFAPGTERRMIKAHETAEKARHIEHLMTLNETYAPKECTAIAERMTLIKRAPVGWTVDFHDPIQKHRFTSNERTKRDAERKAREIIRGTARRMAERYISNGYTGYEDY